MTAVILARHGETRLNVERRFRGRADPPLSEDGRIQARRLGAALATPNVPVILSSPRLRARETAAAIAEHAGAPYEVDPRLDDVDYGKWTGLTAAEAKARWPELYTDYVDDPALVRFPGGESIENLAARAGEVLLAPARSEAAAVFVTHDIVIRVLLCAVLGCPLRAMHQLRIDLASSTALHVATSVIRLEWMNNTCHLPSSTEREARP